MVAELAWPLTLDVTPALDRLDSMFFACFSNDVDGPNLISTVRDGMAQRAIAFGRAYSSLLWIASDPLPIYPLGDVQDSSDELRHVLRIRNDWPELIKELKPTQANKWALHVIPSLNTHSYFSMQTAAEHFLDQVQAAQIRDLDERDFANYLCCLISFFTPLSRALLAETDRR
jgi:hypothetical protein